MKSHPIRTVQSAFAVVMNRLSPAAERSEKLAPGTLFIGVCACFLLSGFAALLYQTAWMRLFSTYFGTSEYAVATVLASYMAGLALGAWVAARYLHNVTRPVLLYGVLEALIAISALCVPLLMAGAGGLYGIVVGGQPEPPDAGGLAQPLFYLIASIFILMIPTACMGATLPVLMRYVIQSDSQVGSRTGVLYAINTGGAIFGTVAAAFLFLPALGLCGTVLIGVGVNFLVFIIAAVLARYTRLVPADGDKEASQAIPLGFSRLGRVRWILPAIAASGAVSFVYEVLWTRLLGHVVGGSVTAFATMLAAFLTGIAIGGGIGGMLAKDRNRAAWLFVGVQIGIAVLSAVVYYWIDDLIPATRSASAHATMAFLVMLPSTIFIGATFPLAVRVLAEDEHDASRKAAHIFTWNTCGAIIGSLAAAFLIIPALGYGGTIVACVAANLALALLVAVKTVGQPRIWITASLALMIGATAFLWQPGRPDAVITNTVFYTNPLTSPQERFYRVGSSATVLTLTSFAEVHYRTNGLPEANVFRKGAAPAVLSQQWLSAAPALTRPEAEEMLVVGLGGGAVLEGVPGNIRQIDVIELEPQVVAANRRGTREQHRLDAPHPSPPPLLGWQIGKLTVQIGPLPRHR